MASRLGLPRFDWSLTLLGLCIFTFVIVTYYFNVAVLGIIVAAVGLVVERERVRVPFPVWLYGAFVLWAFVASFASPFPDIALEQVVERLKLLLVMLIAVNALRTEGQLRFYLLFFLGCYMLFPARGALVNYLVGYTEFGRVLWGYIYANSNDLAALSLLALGIALGVYMSEPSRNGVRLGSGISALVLIVIILLTQSRGVFLGLLVAVTPAVFRLMVKKPGGALVTGLVLALVIALTIPASVWERLSGIGKLTNTETIAEADAEGSAAERFEILKVGWEILSDHPVFGVGLGAYGLANEEYAPELGGKDTHNTYLNLAAETGLPGLLIWCVMFASVLRYAYRIRRRALEGMPAIQQYWIERSLAGYLVAGLFGTYGALTFPYLMLAVLWCSATLLDGAVSRTVRGRKKRRR